MTLDMTLIDRLFAYIRAALVTIAAALLPIIFWLCSLLGTQAINSDWAVQNWSLAWAIVYTALGGVAFFMVATWDYRNDTNTKAVIFMAPLFAAIVLWLIAIVQAGFAVTATKSIRLVAIGAPLFFTIGVVMAREVVSFILAASIIAEERGLIDVTRTICPLCNLEMAAADDCPANREVKYPDGEKLPAIPFEGELENSKCGDCGVEDGNYHHEDCLDERCPRCGDQRTFCACFVICPSCRSRSITSTDTRPEKRQYRCRDCGHII